MSQRRTRQRTAPARPPDTAPCPCGGGEYGSCCGPAHRGDRAAATAEALMRSRYSAFAVGDRAYLERTWHPDTRPARVEADPDTEWTGLEILETGGGTPFHTEGTVRFRARYREGGRAGEMVEHSRFVRLEGAWVYLDALPS
ncbi:YchJ family protein [Nocardiopsis dassonvillei]|uniref:YchJ family protein n=1 Tax=Nocardiopsis dassonvillei TaxID=2014 RepID=UPI003F54E7DA